MRLFLPVQLHGLSLALKVRLKISYIVRDSARLSLPLLIAGRSSSKAVTSVGSISTLRPGKSAFSLARRSSHPQSSATAWTSLSIPVAFVSFAILSPSPLDFFSDTSYRGVEFVAADARRLGK